MTTFVRAPEAARRLDVSLNTLYAYVSRGRISRTTATDGRTSLFDLDEVDALRARSRRTAPIPPPSIDVRIATGVTHLDEAGVRYRGHRVVDLIDHDFETVAELLWTGERSADERASSWQGLARPTPMEISIDGLIRLALAIDAEQGPTFDPVEAGRRLLATIPTAFGSSVDDHTAGFARRLAGCWRTAPDDDFVAAVDAALILLADHELATSTLAVRVATSTRASAMMSVVAGLAAVSGELHGAAAVEAHRLITRSIQVGADVAVDEAIRDGRRVPGFGHSIYRNVDPRFELLVERVAAMPDSSPVVDTISDLVAVASRRVAKAPNIDLALGALLVAADLPDDTPLFAVARIAGWIAHHVEELDERPIRYRGLAR